MIRRDVPFNTGGWYHCYNLSIESRIAFTDIQDYQRFLEILYLANENFPLRRNDLGKRPFNEIFMLPRGKRLVSIAAFSLMPRHFHLALKELVDGGITSFMRKIGTAYSLYFNMRHKREGNLFLKPFRSRHLPTSQSLEEFISYVHATPAALYEPEWKKSHVVDHQFLAERILAYPYSSMRIHAGMKVPAGPVVDLDALPKLGLSIDSIERMLQEARRYCAHGNFP